MKKIISLMLSILIISQVGVKIAWAEEGIEGKQHIICIDPGHQKKGDNRLEPVSPSGGGQKARVSSGTSGVATKKAEYVVNLEASMILKEMLESKNYKVVMTRENHDINISNAERARLGNDSKAELVVRIHCDSLSDSSKTGATVLVPSAKNQNTKAISKDSKRYGDLLSKELKKSGVKVNGVFERADITGFNWSTVPVVILEMGFMSNFSEDQMLSNPNYQKKLMVCVTNAIEEYFKLEEEQNVK
ncbi:MAG: N-acetylmuramoyl-L-alanine amidase family protein [Clostridium sp.]